jgi:signal transduction histidine kinase
MAVTFLISFPRNTRLKDARPLLNSVLLALSLFGSASAAALFRFLAPNDATSGILLALYIPLAISMVALVFSFFSEQLLSYYFALAIRLLMYLLTVISTASLPPIAFILLACVLSELAYWEPYPINMAEMIGLSALSFAIALFSTRGLSSNPLSWLSGQLPLFLFGILVSIFGSTMTRFRESTADLLEEKERLTNSVVQLTRANSAYQEYAVRANETAAKAERQRITSDIHDIVGYTLTNNIMLLEAAQDLMQDNPLGLPTIIETARANSEEGLERVRAALYQLRRQEAPSSSGLQAIHRLASVFEQATAIVVKCEYGDLPWKRSERIDSTLYHLVQESLVNAFRHARATEVRINFHCVGDSVVVRIADDGPGGQKGGPEGIGIRGMRERVSALGGSFRAESTIHGFLVEATLPIGAITDG